MDWPILREKLLTRFSALTSEKRSWNMLQANANISFVGQYYCFTKNDVLFTEGYGQKSLNYLLPGLKGLGLDPAQLSETPFQVARYDLFHRALFDESLPLYTRDQDTFARFVDEHRDYFEKTVKPYVPSPEQGVPSIDADWLLAHVPIVTGEKLSEAFLDSVLNDPQLNHDVNQAVQRAIVRKLNHP